MPSTSKLQHLLNLSLKTFYPAAAATPVIQDLYNYFNKINLNDEIDVSFIHDAALSSSSSSIEKFLREKSKVYERLKFENLKLYMRSDAPVLHMDVYEKPSCVSLGLFLIRKGFRMPFHNHPQMYGFIKVLHGTGTFKAYTRVSGDDTTTAAAGIIKARHEFTKQVNENSDVLTLEPRLANIHEICASTDSDLVFLDLIVPPYLDNNCTYYELINENEFKVLDETPVDFFCDSLNYYGPKLRLDY